MHEAPPYSSIQNPSLILSVPFFVFHSIISGTGSSIGSGKGQANNDTPCRYPQYMRTLNIPTYSNNYRNLRCQISTYLSRLTELILILFAVQGASTVGKSFRSCRRANVITHYRWLVITCTHSHVRNDS